MTHKIRSTVAMAAHFSSIINVVSSTEEPVAAPQAPRAPQKSVTRTYHSVQQPNAIELDSLKWGQNINRPSASGTTTPGVETPSGWSTPGWQSPGWQTPQTPSALEMSRPQTPNDAPGHALQSFSNPPKNKYRMTATCLLNFSNGLSDAAAGPLIPKMIMHVMSFPKNKNNG